MTGVAGPDTVEVAYRGVDDVDRPGSPVSTIARFGVEGGRPRRLDL